MRDYLESPQSGWSAAGNPSSFITLTPAFGVTGLLRDPNCAALGGFPGFVPGATSGAAPTPVCNWQYSPFDALTEEEDRYQVFSAFDVDITDSTTFHVEGLYAETDIPIYRTSPSYAALQTPGSIATGGTSPVAGRFYVPANNPGFVDFVAQNPSFPSAAGGAFIVANRPFGLGGNPFFDYGSSEGPRHYEAYRVSAALNGEIATGLGWDVAVTYMEENATRRGRDTVVNRYQLALRGLGGPACNVAANTPGTNGCLWYNPFSNAIPGNAITGQTNPQFRSAVANENRDLLDWMFPIVSTDQTSTLLTVDAVLNGKMGLSLGGSNIGWALGAQYRDDGYETIYSDLNNLTITPCVNSIATGIVGASGSVDYWGFDFDNPVVQEPVAGIVNGVFPNGNNLPNNCGNPAVAALVNRFTFQDANANGIADDCATANIARLDTRYINGPKVKTSGIDVNAEYLFDNVLGGSVEAGLGATYVLKYDVDDAIVEGIKVADAFDAAGQLNYQTTAYPLPQLKGNVYLQYAKGAHNVRAVTNYIDDYVDQRTDIFQASAATNTGGAVYNPANNRVIGGGKVIDAFVTYDLYYRIELPWNTALNASVENLTDEDPSFARLDLAYDPFTSSAFGRGVQAGPAQALRCRPIKPREIRAVARGRRCMPAPSTIPLLQPVARCVVIVVHAVAIGFAAFARELLDRVGGRGLQLILGQIDHITAFRFVVIERAPRQRVIFFTDAEKAAEADDGEHDVVRGLVENDVLDLANLRARRIFDSGAKDTLGTDRGRVACCGGHDGLLCRKILANNREVNGAHPLHD